MASDAPNPSLVSLVTSRFTTNALSAIPRSLHLRTMDSELAALELAIRQARQMRNSRAGACNLPREVIAHIFECLQRLWPPRRVYVKAKPRFYAGWMSVSHVCSVWREVALDVPSLWTRPKLDVFSIPHQYITDILIRSRSGTLDLSVIWGGGSEDIEGDPGVKAWLSPAISRRTSGLTIVAEDDMEASLLAFELPKQWQRLHTLNMTQREPDTILELPPSLQMLRGITCLSLEGYHIPWNTPILSSALSELHLGYDDLVHRPPYDKLRATLASLELLEVLELRNIAPRFGRTGSQLPLIMPASLQRLKTSCMTNPALGMDALTFVSLIHTCPRCNRYHALPGFSNHTPNITLINDTLSQLLPVLALSTNDDLQIRHLHLICDAMRLVSDAIPPLSSDQLSRPSKELVSNTLFATDFTKNEPPMHFHLADYLPHVPLERLRTISLDTSSVRFIERKHLWPRLLRADSVCALGLLKTHTPYNDFAYMLDALRVPQAGSKGDEARMLFPRLEVLAVPFTKDEGAHSKMIIALIDLLHVRQESRMPLLELLVPKEAGHWTMWHSLRAMLKITAIDYPTIESPVVPYDSWT
ncbi:unnamed protein product [Peniophora sp. CBMAI 1063]|nr:unnamed protein product [Peniophora sp. CBMAI 1063]